MKHKQCNTLQLNDKCMVWIDTIRLHKCYLCVSLYVDYIVGLTQHNDNNMDVEIDLSRSIDRINI